MVTFEQRCNNLGEEWDKTHLVYKIQLVCVMNLFARWRGLSQRPISKIVP